MQNRIVVCTAAGLAVRINDPTQWNYYSDHLHICAYVYVNSVYAVLTNDFFFASSQSVLEYERYLKEVVNALESDPEFRKKLDNASEVDVRVSIPFHLYEVLPIYTIFNSFFFVFIVWQNCSRIGICRSSCAHEAGRNQAKGNRTHSPSGDEAIRNLERH